MEIPFTAAAFQPDAAFAGAAARFFELLQSFAARPAGPAVQAGDWTSLAGTLAGQFEQWLKTSPAAGVSLAAAAGFAPGASAGPLGAVPLGAAAAQPQDAQGVWDLLVRLARLQGQLAAHWSEIANSSAQKFIARVRVAGAGASAGTPEAALKLYEMWVDCAEEAYGATVRSDDFCRLQAQLANTGAALLLAQRQHAEALARACGLPTREEADALQRQIRELREQLQEQARRAGRRPWKPRARAARTAPKKASAGRARRAGRGRRPRA
ncbi:MAG: poly(R)-hydroxyalkanoic acid synthase subunit PhaE [Steroidobacteraceae bacterium]